MVACNNDRLNAVPQKAPSSLILSFAGTGSQGDVQ